jgi:KipI family sensor histidine kinase inhibitor
VKWARGIVRSLSPYDMQPFGDAALAIATRSAEAAGALGVAIRAARIDGVVDVVGGFDSVVVIYEPGLTDFDRVAAQVRSVTVRPPEDTAAKMVALPTSFDGPDLDEVGRISGLGAAGVERALLRVTLRVSVLGFTPGFAYLTGLPRRLRRVPRRPTPRTSVPAGSLALAGGHAAVYPQSTPGGWHLVGRTDVALFDPESPPYALLAPGDLVRLRAVAPDDLRPLDPEPVKRPLLRAPSAVFSVIDPGLFSTVQDRGRLGVAHLGVPRAGVADPVSAALANALLGNPADAAVLECTVSGPTLLCRTETHAAVVGAGAGVRLDGMEIAPGRVFPVALGQRLALGSSGHGLRAYLAVRGGFTTPAVLGSRSSDRLAGLGVGPLVSGDELAAGHAAGPMADHLVAGFRAGSPGGRKLRVVVVGGEEAWAGLLDRPFEVTEASDRVGLRLRPIGDPPAVAVEADTGSAGTTVGTVQIPPDGHPVVLMVDHATTGGYPVGAVVITADLGELGQCRPGDTVELVVVTAAEAAAALRALRRWLDGAVVGPYPVQAG